MARMTSAEYKTARRNLGTQTKVAAMLGVARSTVERRERGKMTITREAVLAMRSLKINQKKDCKPCCNV